ncbi:MAG: GDP-mannose dehydrogenase [Rhodospirillaceae bacterium]|nr:GDP-mannose dehydrogenase [Rhodospirillaceae bacterium]
MPLDMTISVVGLGYVGLPVAVAFAKSGMRVVGFDINEERVSALARGHDVTAEVPEEDLAKASEYLLLTTNPADLASAEFHVVTVPTPIRENRQPDLRPLESASRTLGRAIRPGSIVVYESTVYPGATEGVCLPILEAESGLKGGKDFYVAYSPERINPGDREHRFETITKIVSGQTPEVCETVAKVYGSVVRAGLHKAPTIRVAEAAKVLENTQRDLNIALMNELALICHRLDIDTRDVLAAAGTKWNFLPFTPGLVGGHCIGVDPYYLTHRAEEVGYRPEVILAGRRINDGMGAHVATETVRRLLAAGHRTPLSVAVLGLTFKGDVPDIRNSRVLDIVTELESFGVSVSAHDPMADPDQVMEEMGIRPVALDEMPPADAVILAVPHAAFRDGGWPLIQGLLRPAGGLVVDVPAVLGRDAKPDNVLLWRL